VDESGFEKDVYRPHGYATKGLEIIGERSGKRTTRSNLILGSQNGKLIAPMIFKNTIDTDCFNMWVKHCLIDKISANSTIVLDNASFHKKKDLDEILSDTGHKILFLPPYSPDLNPIENSFANIKKFRLYQPLDTPIEEIIKSYVN